MFIVAASRDAFDRQRFRLRPTTSMNDPRFTFRDPLTGTMYRDLATFTSIKNSGKGPGVSAADKCSLPFSYRDPKEVFREFFGGREPFVEAFSNEQGKAFNNVTKF